MTTSRPSTHIHALTTDWTSEELAALPVAVIGAGPVGLAAAGHLLDRGLGPVVLEAGDAVGAAMASWGHIRTFTPWKYIVDATAEKLLAPTGWVRPAGEVPPTGAEIVEQYLAPLAERTACRPRRRRDPHRSARHRRDPPRPRQGPQPRS